MADLTQNCSGCAAMEEGPTRGEDVWMALVALLRTATAWWRQTGGHYKVWRRCGPVPPQGACAIGLRKSGCWIGRASRISGRACRMAVAAFGRTVWWLLSCCAGGVRSLASFVAGSSARRGAGGRRRRRARGGRGLGGR
eukprot:12109770-Alexandrium_andersonii.AAC.1